jgi:hypothetical protein
LWGAASTEHPIFIVSMPYGDKGPTMAQGEPWKKGKAVALALPQEGTARQLDSYNNGLLLRQLRVVEVIQIEAKRIQRNYPIDSPEYPIFDKIQRLLRILHNTIKEEST